MTELVRLTPAQLESDAFLVLLDEAAGRPALILREIRDTELPLLVVRGIVSSGAVIAFAAWDDTSDPTVLEYIAVDADHRSTGLGRVLIDGIRRSRPSAARAARTSASPGIAAK